jgi:hypothetical protein
MDTNAFPELAQWRQAAYELGKEHAKAAASWVTDGNESDESRRQKLAGLENGDPDVMDLLPQPPNLSGEWADDSTPRSLVREVTGRTDFGSADANALLEEILADMYEEGVDETFYPACERELRGWIDDSPTAA